MAIQVAEPEANITSDSGDGDGSASSVADGDGSANGSGERDGSTTGCNAMPERRGPTTTARETARSAANSSESWNERGILVLV